MFGSTVIDIAIGLIFVHLLLSLTCPAVKPREKSPEEQRV